jgi:hypothetical protein
MGSSIINTSILITQPSLEDFVSNYLLDFYHEDGTFCDFASEGICTNQKIYIHQVVSI